MGLWTLLQEGRGFTLLEVIIVIAIAGILAAIGVPSYINMVKDQKLTQYAVQLEYLAKYARITAMERTKNIGVCAKSNTQMVLYDLGGTRPSYAADSCPTSGGTELPVNLTVSSGDNTSYSISLRGSTCTTAGTAPFGCISIDPRGLGIFLGNVCIQNGRNYFKAVVNRTGVRIEKGAGGCP